MNIMVSKIDKLSCEIMNKIKESTIIFTNVNNKPIINLNEEINSDAIMKNNPNIASSLLDNLSYVSEKIEEIQKIHQEITGFESHIKWFIFD